MKFCGIEIETGEGCFTPQPHTEYLMKEFFRLCPINKCVSILDYCAGSGAMGLSAMKHYNTYRTTFVENSDSALIFLKRNIYAHFKHQVVVREDILQIDEKYDIIVSNPPYGKDDLNDVHPRDAFVSGSTGFEFFPILKKCFSEFLSPGGCMLIECGNHDVASLFDNGERIEKIDYKKSPLGLIVHKDS